MTEMTPADTLHRLVKHALDSGTAASIAEAQAVFQGYTLNVHIGDADVDDRDHQAALLTIVALGRRVFHGGVLIDGVLNVPLRIPVLAHATLADAVAAAGGTLGQAPEASPAITIGNDSIAPSSIFHIRTFYDGWRGGILPSNHELPERCGEVMPLAPMLAAALAVNEAYKYASDHNPLAGREAVGMSLWSPAPTTDWLITADEPDFKYLPSNVWLIGLGHLGQAYLWALGLLPYMSGNSLELVLQDVDKITPSTESTSILTTSSMVGKLKTRAMASWADGRGFSTSIVERYFDRHFKRHTSEPAVALCGLDNALGRRALDQVGFDLVIEAGLGRDFRNFRCIRLHTLPGPKPASEIWSADMPDARLPDLPVYQDMIKRGELDRCGVTMLAGKAVGAPFVGAVAACLVVSELLRHLHGGAMHQLIDLNLTGLEHRSAVPHRNKFSTLNPGFAQR